MGGLLYKDFVAIRGKKLILITGIALVLFTILRVVFPGSREIPGVMAKNDDGEVLNMIDVFLWYGEFCVLMVGYGQVSASWYRTSELDEKNRVRNYFSSLPLRKQTYVAEKYIFTAITAYVWFSVYMIWHIVFSAFAGEGFLLMDVSNLLVVMALPIFCFALLQAALNMPMLLLLGREKTKLILTGIVMTICMCVLGFVLFGDVGALANWDVKAFMEWIKTHDFEIVLTTIIAPLITLVLYYLSYRITASLWVKKEVAADE